MKTFKGTVALIGARSGSKRVPNKNIKLLGGAPLISYSICTAKASYFIDKTIVSTDSTEIAAVALSYDADIPFLRPKEFASDSSTDYDWISHFIREYTKKMTYYPKNIVFLRPTTPFRSHYVVDRAIHALKVDRSSMRSVEQIPEAIEKTFRITDEETLIPSYPNVSIEDTNLPNQEFISSYKANGYIDILNTEYILDTKSLYGNNIQAFITPKTLEIDNLEDFDYAEFLLHKGIINDTN
jgi:CMP-N,N'-diacetyllegionaminic acid synthase